MHNLAEKSFLIFDDDPKTRDILDIMLRQMLQSRSVALRESSAQLDEQLSQLNFVPDVVFLDVVIRPFDGYNILHKLLQTPLFHATKIVAVTAKVMPNDIEKMRQAGFHGLISKPIIRQVFPELVQRILAGESVWYIA
ncbi:response regulator [Candidatus Leptofilum sp.]|uniref:response regulator n=1 Tax=Candidatus Leptofilum sp. TaxID=3241576 RepID=UPI003B5CC13B